MNNRRRWSEPSLSGRARRIAALEQPTVSAPDTEASALAELEKMATAEGLPFEEWLDKHAPAVTHLVWSGGRDSNVPGKQQEIEALVERGLTAHDALELFLIAIMRGLYKQPKSAQLTQEEELMIRRVKSQLLNEPTPSGRPPIADCEAVCVAIAPQYFLRTMGFRQSEAEQTLAALLKKQLGLEDKDYKAKNTNDKRIRPYERYFKANIDRIMCRVSWDSIQDAERRAQFLNALRALEDLGMKVDIDFIAHNWRTL